MLLSMLIISYKLNNLVVTEKHLPDQIPELSCLIFVVQPQINENQACY